MSVNCILEEDLRYIHRKFQRRDQLDGATILITGCAGFLGFGLLSYLVNYADQLGIRKIIGVDNFLISSPTWLTALVETRPDVLELHNFDIVRPDIESIQSLEDTPHVLHMASVASPVFYRQFPLQTIDGNVTGLRNLLDYFKDRSLAGFLFFSSSEVYGNPTDDAIPTPETYRGLVSTTGPRACYDEAKRFGETLCYYYANLFGIPISIARPFNNYGPGMRLDDKRVPADFALSALSGKPISILSNGMPTRTFCYVADAIVGYLQLLCHGSFIVCNVGIDKGEITIARLAEIYSDVSREVFGNAIKIELSKPTEAEYLVDNPQRRCPDLSRARSEIGYAPEIDVEEGVRRYLKFLKNEGLAR